MNTNDLVKEEDPKKGEVLFGENAVPLPQGYVALQVPRRKYEWARCPDI